mgnify:CR=1 FL=1
MRTAMASAQGTVWPMSRRAASLAVLSTLALASPAHAAYVQIKGAPGYGPAKYANLHVDKIGKASAKHVLVLIPGTFAGSGSFCGP